MHTLWLKNKLLVNQLKKSLFSYLLLSLLLNHKNMPDNKYHPKRYSLLQNTWQFNGISCPPKYSTFSATISNLSKFLSRERPACLTICRTLSNGGLLFSYFQGSHLIKNDLMAIFRTFKPLEKFQQCKYWTF